MENNTIKSVVFGGFSKQDVIDYIEKTSKEASDAQRALEQENQELQDQLDELKKENELLRSQVEKLGEDRKQLENELESERGSNEELEPLKPQLNEMADEIARLELEAEALRPDAEAYARFREKLGEIECDGRKRAADLEDLTAGQMLKTLNQFRSNYQELMNAFETAASFVNAELRKVEVNLTQLPRAMDKTGAELNELAATLERTRKQDE